MKTFSKQAIFGKSIRKPLLPLGLQVLAEWQVFWQSPQTLAAIGFAGCWFFKKIGMFGNHPY